MFSRAAPGGRSRTGIVVPRYGHTIVKRNRLKRRLRECVRTMPWRDDDAGARDVLVRARPAAYEAAFDELRESLRRGMEPWV
jgi:ribonuclease P protein component